MKRILLPLLAGTLLLCANSLTAQTIRKIAGRVVIGPESKLAGATIYLLRTTDSSTVKHAVIDSEGCFVFRHVPESDYLLCIRAEGLRGYYSALFDTTEKDHIELALRNLRFHKETPVAVKE